MRGGGWVGRVQKRRRHSQRLKALLRVRTTRERVSVQKRTPPLLGSMWGRPQRPEGPPWFPSEGP